ncbi:MAG: oxalurate catabolism protein HpxZ [Acidimicrobiales bacterium]|jgi:hypothetical protein
MMMDVNRSEVVAEIAAEFESYEDALMSNDVEALDNFFWRDPLTIRFGLADASYGHDEIAAARRRGSAADRTLERTVITSYGDSYGTADTEFTRVASGRRGRQTQTWIRFDVGWRIASAHVSWF